QENGPGNLRSPGAGNRQCGGRDRLSHHRAERAAGRRGVLESVIARSRAAATKQSRAARAALDCFVAALLAMTTITRVATRREGPPPCPPSFTALPRQ